MITVAILIFFVYHYNKHYIKTKDPSIESYITYMGEWFKGITKKKQ